jgi:hypothetical protein
MATRTSKETVTFAKPFVLGGSDEVFPKGAYVVETDEELLEGISFPAYRRILTLIHLHSEPKYPGRFRTLTVDPTELEAALMRDKPPAETANSQNGNQKTVKRIKESVGNDAAEKADSNAAPTTEHRLSVLGPRATSDKDVEEDLLEIPLHLRRQAD